MNNRLPPKRPPGKNLQRPTGPQHTSPGSQPSKHYWHYRHWPYWDYDWYDWDWYDYDYDWYDSDHDWEYAPNRKKKPSRPRAEWDSGTSSDVMAAYQQGFKDGWYAAMDYMSYSEGTMIEPKPPAPPAPPMPAPETPE